MVSEAADSSTTVAEEASTWFDDWLLGLEQAVKENREKRITEVLKIFVLMEFSGFIF